MVGSSTKKKKGINEDNNLKNKALETIKILNEKLSNKIYHCYDSSEIDVIGKNICMHIAASAPKSLTVDDLDKSIIENEKEIISKQLKETGKPDNILEKMMQGKLNKFYEENTLMGQKFVIDPSISIEQYLALASKEINCQINIQEFLRFEIGS